MQFEALSEDDHSSLIDGVELGVQAQLTEDELSPRSVARMDVGPNTTHNYISPMSSSFRSSNRFSTPLLPDKVITI
jgi:hypothetical protein